MPACKVASVMSDSLQPCGLKPAKLLCPWGFSSQEYWSGLSCPPPRDLLDPGIKPSSLMSPTLARGFFTISATQEAPSLINRDKSQSQGDEVQRCK